jgi:hypothetical protein
MRRPRSLSKRLPFECARLAQSAGRPPSPVVVPRPPLLAPLFRQPRLPNAAAAAPLRLRPATRRARRSGRRRRAAAPPASGRRSERRVPAARSRIQQVAAAADAEPSRVARSARRLACPPISGPLNHQELRRASRAHPIRALYRVRAALAHLAPKSASSPSSSFSIDPRPASDRASRDKLIMLMSWAAGSEVRAFLAAAASAAVHNRQLSGDGRRPPVAHDRAFAPPDIMHTLRQSQRGRRS